MAARRCTAVAIVLLATALTAVASRYKRLDNVNGNSWDDAHATFYGDMTGGETMQGACGYGDLFGQGYGLETTALSTALFNGGATCGACFQLLCVNAPQSCIKGAKPIRVTATNFCPPNYTKSTEVWCNPPQKHFDLSLPMFLKIAKYKAGIVPVKFRRILCWKKGGVKFQLTGNPYYLMVLVYNVGGAGDVIEVRVKGSKTGWISMERNWGQVWDTGTMLTGQCLSFMVKTSDGKLMAFNNVVPANWRFNQTFDGKTNF